MCLMSKGGLLAPRVPKIAAEMICKATQEKEGVRENRDPRQPM